MRRGNNTPRWSGFLGALILGVLCFPALSSAATVTYASNKVMGPTNGLVGYWTFNGADISGTTVLDRSGLGNNATMQNDPTKTTGKLGQGLQFSQTVSSQLVNAASPSSLDDLNQMTISVWVKRSPSGAQRTVVSKTDTLALSDGWRLSISGGGVLYFQSAFSAQWGQWSFLAPVKVNQWTHLVLTYDRTSPANVPVLYVNASSTLASDLATPSGTTLSDAAALLSIGGVNGFINSFPGSLDDVRIYNRILTPSEITQVYKAGQVQLASVPAKNSSGLVGWWTFDGPDFLSSISDRSENGNHGFVIGQPTTTAKIAGKLGQGLNLNGTTGYISAGTNNVLNMTGNTMSVSSWVRRATPGGAGTLIYRGDIGFNGYIVALGSTPCTANQIKATKFGVVDVCLSGFPADTAWHHVVITWGASGSTLYVDGVATDTNADATNFISASGAVFTIGSFAGTLDDVRIYNRILSPTEVAQLYRDGQVTIKSFTCGVSTVKDIDGNVYNTLKIGTQCWMKQNMRVGTRINVATAQSNNSVIEKYCYSDNPTNCTSNNPNQPDGGLYQWDEAMQYSTTPGARGICPAGWHIPTDTEQYVLENYLKDNGQTCDSSRSGSYDCDTAGTKLKANGISGFEANLAGYVVTSISANRGSLAFLWSSSQNGFSLGWLRRLSSGFTSVTRQSSSKSTASSVRCLQN